MATLLSHAVKLHYTDIGDGQPVVLIHGLGSSLAFWLTGTMAILSRDYRVVAYDLRGHGRSEMPPSGYAPGDMVEDLEGLLDVLAIRRAHVVGHSFGGAVALEYALRFPERVASVTLADTRLNALQPRQRFADWPYWRVWRSQLRNAGIRPPRPGDEVDLGMLERWARYSRARGAQQYVAAVPGLPPFFRGNGRRASSERWLRLVETTTARRELREAPGLTRENIGRLRPPALAIYGQYSHCLPSLRALRETLRDCKVVMIRGAGHFHPVVKPARFVFHLRAFLKRQATR